MRCRFGSLTAGHLNDVGKRRKIHGASVRQRRAAEHNDSIELPREEGSQRFSILSKQFERNVLTEVNTPGNDHEGWLVAVQTERLQQSAYSSRSEERRVGKGGSTR